MSSELRSHTSNKCEQVADGSDKSVHVQVYMVARFIVSGASRGRKWTHAFRDIRDLVLRNHISLFQNFDSVIVSSSLLLREED